MLAWGHEAQGQYPFSMLLHRGPFLPAPPFSRHQRESGQQSRQQQASWRGEEEGVEERGSGRGTERGEPVWRDMVQEHVRHSGEVGLLEESPSQERPSFPVITAALQLSSLKTTLCCLAKRQNLFSLRCGKKVTWEEERCRDAKHVFDRCGVIGSSQLATQHRAELT